MTEEKKVPDLRFPGFTDPWEQRKLRDISSLITKGTTPLDKSGVGDVNFIKVENLDSNSGEVIPGSKISMDEHEGYLKRSQLKAGDILFSIAGTLGRVGIIKSSVLPANTNQALAIIRTKEGNINYISTALRGRAVTDFIHRNPTVGAQPNLSLEQVGDLEIPYPSLDEQKEIGDYFKRLDNLITLHQRKVDDLKTMKTCLLQKMFPKEDENTPELRFPGFTDPWEQRKLNEYLEVSRAKNKDEVFGKEDVLSVSGDYGIVNQIEFQGRSFAGASVAPYGVVETGDVVYTKSPLKSNPYGIIKTNKGKPGIVSTLYAVYKPLDNVYSEFVQIYFEQDARMNNYMHPLVNKGAKNDMKVSDENALKGEVCFPNRDEQIKISEYFAKLDNLITLHQRKVDDIKTMKKCLLQKMFI